jgi:putative YhdH/YhfP family quinone oxidoreductase
MNSKISENLAWAVNRSDTGDHQLVCIESPWRNVNSKEILVKIEYSCLNYKDLLTISGKNGETKSYPQVIGIDAVGTVEQSGCSSFISGTRVGLFSRGLGTTKGGGLSHFLLTDKESAITLPPEVTPLKAMAIGTAGLTAAACVAQIQNEGIQPSSGPILITGAGGGVGRIAGLMLSRLGYQTVLSTREGGLIGMNSPHVIPPLRASKFQLLPEKWVAVLDTLGGDSLATAIKSTHSGGVVLSVGMVTSPDINLSVYPFVLRGVKLIGINLDRIENETIEKYLKLADSLMPLNSLMEFVNVIQFGEVPAFIDLMEKGKHSGRTVVNISSLD